MFCPQCAAENDIDKSYCRQCGQPLSAVRLALECRVDEAIKIVEGDKNLTGHRFRIALAGVVILTAIVTILSGVRIGFANIQSAAVILILVMIYFLHLSRNHHRIARLLEIEKKSSTPGQLGAPNIAAPDSITEQNTLKLKK